jgi:hypothetical protein
MRFYPIILIVLFIVFQSQAAWKQAQGVSGVAVAAQWTGGYNNNTGGLGRIMKYDIVHGTAVNSSVLYDGRARYATISPDGQYVAFIKENRSVAYMSINGGADEELVTGMEEYNGCLDWPVGDWIYFSRGGSNNDASKGIWKVNIHTKEVVQICTFDRRTWTFQTASDGLRFNVRVQDFATDNLEHIARFEISDKTINNTFSLQKGDPVTMFGYGCGTSVAPDASRIMRIENPPHTRIEFHDWNIPEGGEGSSLGYLTLYDMNTWAGEMFVNTDGSRGETGGGMNNNRWSVNSNDWICIQCGINSRNSENGSNQVLVNWVDEQVIRTSLAAWGNKEQSQQNESGDFWLGNIPPVLKIMRVPGKSQAEAFRLTIVPDFSSLNSRIQGHGSIWDISGRRHFPEGPGTGLPTVGIMERNYTIPLE